MYCGIIALCHNLDSVFVPLGRRCVLYCGIPGGALGLGSCREGESTCLFAYSAYDSAGFGRERFDSGAFATAVLGDSTASS